MFYRSMRECGVAVKGLLCDHHSMIHILMLFVSMHAPKQANYVPPALSCAAGTALAGYTYYRPPVRYSKQLMGVGVAVSALSLIYMFYIAAQSDKVGDQSNDGSGTEANADAAAEPTSDGYGGDRSDADSLPRLGVGASGVGDTGGSGSAAPVRTPVQQPSSPARWGTGAGLAGVRLGGEVPITYTTVQAGPGELALFNALDGLRGAGGAPGGTAAHPVGNRRGPVPGTQVGPSGNDEARDRAASAAEARRAPPAGARGRPGLGIPGVPPKAGATHPGPNVVTLRDLLPRGTPGTRPAANEGLFVGQGYALGGSAAAAAAPPSPPRQAPPLQPPQQGRASASGHAGLVVPAPAHEEIVDLFALVPREYGGGPQIGQGQSFEGYKEKIEHAVFSGKIGEGLLDTVFNKVLAEILKVGCFEAGKLRVAGDIDDFLYISQQKKNVPEMIDSVFGFKEKKKFPGQISPLVQELKEKRFLTFASIQVMFLEFMAYTRGYTMFGCEPEAQKKKIEISVCEGKSAEEVLYECYSIIMRMREGEGVDRAFCVIGWAISMCDQ